MSQFLATAWWDDNYDPVPMRAYVIQLKDISKPEQYGSVIAKADQIIVDVNDAILEPTDDFHTNMSEIDNSLEAAEKRVVAMVFEVQ
jgi:hypothetical protein